MLNELFARFDRLAHVSVSATPCPDAGHTHTHTHHVDDGLVWRKLSAHLSTVTGVSTFRSKARPQKLMIIINFLYVGNQDSVREFLLLILLFGLNDSIYAQML